MKPIPVADGILESQFMGLPFGKLLQSAIPVLPAIALLVLQMPWTIYTPPFVVGLALSLYTFHKTPPGQMPSDYLFSWIKRVFRPDERYKAPTEAGKDPVMIQDGGKTIQRKPPATEMESGGVFSANTIDDVPVDGIRNDGVIETDRAFTKIIEIRPAVWSKQPEHMKESILGGYASYLHTVDYPIQWVTYQVPLDLSEYENQLEEAHNTRPDDEPDVITFGRDFHAGFVQELGSDEKQRERRFLLAVSSLKADSEYEQVGGIHNLMPNSISLGSSDKGREHHLRQLRDRVQTARSTLPQCGFEDVSVLDNREAVLQTLRLYYRGESSDGVPAGLTMYGGDVEFEDIHPETNTQPSSNSDLGVDTDPDLDLDADSTAGGERRSEQTDCEDDLEPHQTDEANSEKTPLGESFFTNLFGDFFSHESESDDQSEQKPRDQQ